MLLEGNSAVSAKGRLVVVLAAALLVVGCGAKASPSAPPATSAPVATSAASAAAGALTADITEFKMQLGAASAPAGSVTFNVTNKGTIDHEFVVFKTDLAADKLPLTADGSKVDEAATGLTKVDEIAEFGPGTTKSLTVNLPAGHYVLICNVTTHYTKGIRAEITTGP